MATPHTPRAHLSHHHSLKLREIYRGFSPEIKAVIPVADRVYMKHVGHNPLITGGQEWFGHCLWSLHHTGYAVDFRTIDLPGGGIGPTATKIANEIRAILGKEYYVLLHHDKPFHLHVQFRKGVRATVPGDYEPPSDHLIA